MYISLDVLMRLGQIALIIAGVIALIYLVLLFKSLMDTFRTLQKTLDALTVDLVKLETPLQTVGELTETVGEVSGSAKKAAMSAINVFSQSTDKVSGLFSRRKAQETKQPAADTETGSQPDLQADFQQVVSETPENGIVRQESLVIHETEGDTEND